MLSKFTKYGICLAVFCLLTTTMQAQWSLGLNAVISKPLGEYAQNLNSLPFGLSLNGTYKIPKTRLRVGLELGVAMYANEIYAYDLTQHGFADVSVAFDEEDCYFFYHATLRYPLTNHRVFNVYTEAHAGLSSYFSDRRAGYITSNNQSVDLAAVESLDILQGKTTFHGTAFNTGIGGGITIDAGALFDGKDDSGILIDCGVRFNNGSRALYRSMESSVVVSNSEEGFYRSNTSSIFYKLGVSLLLPR